MVSCDSFPFHRLFLKDPAHPLRDPAKFAEDVAEALVGALGQPQGASGGQRSFRLGLTAFGLHWKQPFGVPSGSRVK